jgi:multidrug efflux pump subunit AcrA (membrane-fusion protein)/uncharacterized protein YraI
VKRKILYGVILLVAVAAIVGYIATNSYAQSFFNRGDDAAESGEEVLPVVIAPDTIIVEAKVVPNRQASLSMPASGIVAEVLVSEGDTVAAGAPLVILQAARQQAAVAQAEANLRNAESNLAQVQAPARPEEIARAQASVTGAQAALQQVRNGPNNADITAARVDLANAEADLRKAQAEYDKVSWANDIGMMPQATALEQATNNYARAQANLEELQKGAGPEEITEAQAQVSSAQADLNLLLAGATSAEIAAAEANVAVAQAALEDAQIALADMTLLAPFDGIAATVDVAVGEQVSPGATVVTLADLNSWRIETEDLTELSVVDVQIGDRVEITLDALPGEAFSGRVTNIRPLGEDKQGDITYTVVVELDEQDPRLRWNMTAETTILPSDVAGDVTGKAPGLAAPAPESAAPAQVEPPAAASAVLPAAELAPAAAQPAAATADTVDTTVTATVLTGGANLNVRAGPGTSYPVIGSARSLETLTVVGRNDATTWLLVELPGGDAGWVSADFAVVRGDVNALPISAQRVDGAEAAPPPTEPSTDSSTPVQPASTGPAASSNAQPAAGLDGTLVFQASSGGAIYAYDLASGALRQLTTGMDPALSPDGQTVAFVREGGEHGLYLVSIDGGNERRIYNGGEQLRAPSWSPDGQWIVFSRLTGEFNCREVGSGLCFPDNAFLEGFDLVGKPERGLSIVNSNGQNFRDLPALNTAVTPSWGSAGIVYAASSGLELTSDQPGATTQAVVKEIRYQDPDLSPDGGRIVFHSVEGNHRELFTVNTDGSGLQALTRPLDLLADEFAQNAAPVWSPDGSQIAFVSNRTEDGGVGDWGIWVMNADGGNLRRLPIDVAIQYNFQGEQVVSWQ